MMDPTLAIALVFSIGWALSYRAKWKRADRASELYRDSAKRAWSHVDSVVQQYNAVTRENAEHRAKWLDMKRRYLDSLDEIAALRDGAAE